SVKSVSPTESKLLELKSVTSHPSRFVRISSASLPRCCQSSGVQSAYGGKINWLAAKKSLASAMYRLMNDLFIWFFLSGSHPHFLGASNLCEARLVPGTNYDKAHPLKRRGNRAI